MFRAVDRLIGQGLAAGRCEGPGDREPAADLVRPVAGQLDFLIGQIHTLSTSPRSSMKEPPVELLVDVAHPGHTDEVRQAARPDQRDPIQSDIGTDGLAQRDADRVPVSGFVVSKAIPELAQGRWTARSWPGSAPGELCARRPGSSWATSPAVSYPATDRWPTFRPPARGTCSAAAVRDRPMSCSTPRAARRMRTTGPSAPLCCVAGRRCCRRSRSSAPPKSRQAAQVRRGTAGGARRIGRGLPASRWSHKVDR